MARERIIEGTWNCGSCGATGIKARHKSCPSCSNPRESGKETQFDFGEAAASGALKREEVKEADVLALAAAGPDWFCPFCEAANRGDVQACRTCSAPREADAKTGLDAPAAATVAERAPPRPARPWFKGARGCVSALVAGSMALCTGLCGFGYWLERTHQTSGTVQSVAWTRTVKRETFKRVERTGWRDELRETPAVMPVAGRGEVAGLMKVRGCQRKQRGTRDVPDGTRRVCSTRSRSVACGTEESCSTQDMGNGFRKEVCHDVTKYCSESYEDCHDETKYRQEPVYGEECRYDTFEWAPDDTRTLRGSTDPVTWPDLPARELDRLQRSESYEVKVSFEEDGKPLSAAYNPASEAEFLRLRPGERVALLVTNGGKVKQVTPWSERAAGAK